MTSTRTGSLIAATWQRAHHPPAQLALGPAHPPPILRPLALGQVSGRSGPDQFAGQVWRGCRHRHVVAPGGHLVRAGQAPSRRPGGLRRPLPDRPPVDELRPKGDGRGAGGAILPADRREPGTGRDRHGPVPGGAEGSRDGIDARKREAEPLPGLIEGPRPEPGDPGAFHPRPRGAPGLTPIVGSFGCGRAAPSRPKVGSFGAGDPIGPTPKTRDESSKTADSKGLAKARHAAKVGACRGSRWLRSVGDHGFARRPGWLRSDRPRCPSAIEPREFPGRVGRPDEDRSRTLSRSRKLVRTVPGNDVKGT